MMRREGSLDYLCLELGGLVEGEDTPLTLSELQWQGIWKAKTLRLVTEVEGLAVLALGVGPEWERLSLEAVDEIDIQALSCKVFGKPRAQLAVHLGDGMARTGRTCHVRPRRENRDWNTEGVVHVTSVAKDGMQSFDEAMSCGCQCCLLCLRWAGVLPREFRVAAVAESTFGTILKDEGDGDGSQDDYELDAGEDESYDDEDGDDSDEDTANSDEDGEDSTGGYDDL